jgi:hypothetical protein
LEVGQQTPVLLMLKGRELKSFTVKTEKDKNGRFYYWEAVMVGKLLPCFRKTWELNLMYVVFYNQMLFL